VLAELPVALAETAWLLWSGKAMTNFARIVGGVAIDVSGDPESHFHPDIAAEFEEVPDTVKCGWRMVDDEWEAPEAIELPIVTIEPKEVDPITFKLLFTSTERIAAKALRATDPVIDDFWSILDDPRTRTVDMRIPSIQAVIEHTLDAIEAAPERKDQILQGIIR